MILPALLALTGFYIILLGISGGKVKIEAGANDSVPFYYGITYSDYEKGKVFMHPIPFNFVIRIGRFTTYYWNKWRFKPTHFDKLLEYEKIKSHEAGQILGAQREKTKKGKLVNASVKEARQILKAKGLN